MKEISHLQKKKTIKLSQMYKTNLDKKRTTIFGQKLVRFVKVKTNVLKMYLHCNNSGFIYNMTKCAFCTWNHHHRCNHLRSVTPMLFADNKGSE